MSHNHELRTTANPGVPKPESISPHQRKSPLRRPLFAFPREAVGNNDTRLPVVAIRHVDTEETAETSDQSRSSFIIIIMGMIEPPARSPRPPARHIRDRPQKRNKKKENGIGQERRKKSPSRDRKPRTTALHSTRPPKCTIRQNTDNARFPRSDPLVSTAGCQQPASQH
jgi:hypothetical protein